MGTQRVLAVAVVFLFLVGLGFGQSQRRTEPFEYTVAETEVLVCNCGGFDVLEDYVVLIRGTLLYDKDGELVKEVHVARLIGQDRFYNSNDPDLFVLGGPGEVETARFDYKDGWL